MDPRVEHLDALADRLESLVTMLGGEQVPGGDAMDRAWSAVSRAFEDYRSLAEQHVGETPPQEVRERMEAVLRLDAVAVGLASRHRDTLAAELDKAAGARSHIRALDANRQAATTGESCDIAG